MEPFVTALALIGIVIVVASLLSGALERAAVPVVAAVLALGALLGPWGLGLVDITFASPELRVLATLALTLVLFSDAVSLDSRRLRRQRQLLLRLLGPGTLIPAVIVALAAWLLLDLPPGAAAILGAGLASTDPVLLRHALRAKALPETARTALRLETGLNDITLLPIIVIAIVVLGGSPQGRHAPPPDLRRSLLGLFVLGPVLGVLVGWLGISALGWVRRRTGVRRIYESMYALGLAVCAYAAAEAVGGSGFVAAFVAGVVIDARDTELCDCFMEYGEASAEMFLLLTFVALGTHLIWTGFDVLSWRTLLFAGVALAARTVVLYPILGGLGLERRERRLIALLGPRGLSSLLLMLLPVFAGVPGAESLFSIACMVVLISLVLHGGAMAALLHSLGGTAPPTAVPEPAATPSGSKSGAVLERITLAELRAMQERGEPVMIADTRKDAAWTEGDPKAAGAVRLPPDDPVAAATALGLPRDGTIAVYCA